MGPHESLCRRTQLTPLPSADWPHTLTPDRHTDRPRAKQVKEPVFVWNPNFISHNGLKARSVPKGAIDPGEQLAHRSSWHTGLRVSARPLTHTMSRAQPTPT